jgi:transketolase
MGSGSEVEIVVQAAEQLAQDGIPSRVVSFPSWELFEAQPESYREEVLPRAVRARVAAEAGISQGWRQWVGDNGVVVGIDRFGVSAPYQEAYEFLGLTPPRVVEAAKQSIEGSRRD